MRYGSPGAGTRAWVGWGRLDLEGHPGGIDTALRLISRPSAWASILAFIHSFSICLLRTSSFLDPVAGAGVTVVETDLVPPQRELIGL